VKSSARKISLTSYDDLFQTDENRIDAAKETITEMPLSELHSPENHPFKVRDDEAMREMAESVEKLGVTTPAIVRPLEAGGYEIIAGNRRKRACELAGKETMPVIVREMDDDTATITMVDSNLQRESLLPSERGFLTR
jgi:ParB family chromosome partitioning protein